MLQITDLHHNKHIINLANLNNVVIRDNNGTNVVTFHMAHQHAVPVTVDKTTLARIFQVLGEHQ